MALWKLTPVDTSDPNWEASSHCGVVIVRATNEQKARAAAAKAFDVRTRFAPGRGMRLPPWRRPSLVKAEPIQDERYPAEGPTEILEPTL